MKKSTQNEPPKWLMRFLRWFCREDYIDEIEGDILELFHHRLVISPHQARRKVVWDVLRSMRPRNIRAPYLVNSQMNQFKNYIKVYFRRLKLERTHYLMNILSLALGFSVLLFILVYIHAERETDGHHSMSDRIYRVIETIKKDQQDVKSYAVTANPLAGTLKEEFPEVEEAARFIYIGSMNVRYKDRLFHDRNYIVSSPELFKILDLNILSGNPANVSGVTAGAVLSKTMAEKLFLDEDPIGKTLELPNSWDGDVEVIGVMDDMPTNSSYQFKMILVTDFHLLSQERESIENWSKRGMTTLVLLRKGAVPEEFSAKTEAFVSKFYPKDNSSTWSIDLQPYGDIHLGSSQLESFYTEPLLVIPYSSQDYLRIVLGIGILVMLIAILNYVNLSSLQVLRRIQEAGIRKINGASGMQLRVQLFTETFLSAILAYILTIAVVVLLFQQFLQITGLKIGLDTLMSQEMILIQLIVFVIVWISSSLIPSVYFDRLSQSLAVMTSRFFSHKGDRLRRVSVFFQFGISTLLIICSLVIYQQMEFLQTKSLGLDYEKVITWDINSGDARRNAQTIIRELETSSEIISASASSRVPGDWKSPVSLKMTSDESDLEINASHYAIDEDWLDLYQVNLLEGRNFSGVASRDTLKVLLNETAVIKMNLSDPIGKLVSLERKKDIIKTKIIGVVEDFHFQSMHDAIEPIVMMSPNNVFMVIDYFNIKYKNDPMTAITHIEKVREMLDPDAAAEVNFLAEKWQRYYAADQTRSTLVLIATCISIVISMFGLFGLVNFSLERRAKEIGVRKALGATVSGLINSLLKDYAVLLIISLLIAGPIGGWLLSNWLNDFAYRIELSPMVFVLAFIVVSLLSFLTVIFRVYQFAKADPVKSLRYE